MEFSLSYIRFSKPSQHSVEALREALVKQFPVQLIQIIEDTDHGPAGTFYIRAVIRNHELKIGVEFQIWGHGMHQGFTKDSLIFLDDPESACKDKWALRIQEQILITSLVFNP